MTTFLDDSRQHLNTNNIGIEEGTPYPKFYLNTIPPQRIELKSSKNKVKSLKLKKGYIQ